MSKKTERKNKTNLNVEWPTESFFTIKDLWKVNPQFVNITLRVRLTKAISTGQVVEIGNKTGGQGRPEKVFALTPVSQETLDAAKGQGISFVTGAKELIGKTDFSKKPPIVNILQSAAVPA